MRLKKRHDWRNSLIVRLTLMYAVAFTVPAALGFTIFYLRIYSETVAREDLEMQEEAHRYAELLVGKDAASLMEMLAASVEPETELIRIVDTDLQVIAATDATFWQGLDEPGVAAKLSARESKATAVTVKVPGQKHKVRVVMIPAGQQLFVQLFEVLEEIDEALADFRNLLFTLIVILTCSSAVVGRFIAGRALADVASVTQTAEDIIAGDYGRRVNMKGQFQEIQQLGATFNAMLDRIQQLLDTMTETNDNIAHDLRSPLARIRGIAEMALIKGQSVEIFQEMAVSTVEECDNLIEMINTMLEITEIEAGVQKRRKEPIELDTLISDACDLFHPMAESKQIDLQIELPEPISLTGDPRQMQRIVTNILENAIKYTPAQGTISVAAYADKESIRINIEDTGIGISEQDLPHIFKRFFRCDSSRSHGGVGLGLSLVKSYLTAMGGRITVTSTLNKGSCFSLQFPGPLLTPA